MRPERHLALRTVVLCAAVLAATSAASVLRADVRTFMACRSVASGFGQVEQALGSEGPKARGRFSGAEVGYFSNHLPVLLDGMGPQTRAFFDELGAGPVELLSRSEACVMDGACDESIKEEVAFVASDLGAACTADMQGSG